jgi:hypothetical protein
MPVGDAPPALPAVYQVVELRILAEGGPDGTPVHAFEHAIGDHFGGVGCGLT